MRLLVNAPINGLSFGNVSVNILRELFKKNIDLVFFPIGDKAEMDAYDKIDTDFVKYLQSATNNRYSKISKDIPSLKLWHIFGSETRYSKNQSLFTFHEVSEVTNVEKNLLKLQDNIFVSSNYTKNIFKYSMHLFFVYDTSATTLKKIQTSNIVKASVTRSATGDGSTTGFTVTSGTSVDNVLVFLNGVAQKPTTDYTVSSTTLTFVVAPESGEAIVIRELPA